MTREKAESIAFGLTMIDILCLVLLLNMALGWEKERDAIRAVPHQIIDTTHYSNPSEYNEYKEVGDCK